MITRVGKKYRVVSPKKKKNMGTYTSLADAQLRERQIQFFTTMAKATKSAKAAKWNFPGVRQTKTKKSSARKRAARR